MLETVVLWLPPGNLAAGIDSDCTAKMVHLAETRADCSWCQTRWEYSTICDCAGFVAGRVVGLAFEQNAPSLNWKKRGLVVNCLAFQCCQTDSLPPSSAD